MNPNVKRKVENGALTAAAWLPVLWPAAAGVQLTLTINVRLPMNPNVKYKAVNGAKIMIWQAAGAIAIPTVPVLSIMKPTVKR